MVPNGYKKRLLCGFTAVFRLNQFMSANMGFGSANIQRYYTVQQLIEKLNVSACGYRRLLTVERGRISGNSFFP